MKYMAALFFGIASFELFGAVVGLPDSLLHAHAPGALFRDGLPFSITVAVGTVCLVNAIRDPK